MQRLQSDTVTRPVTNHANYASKRVWLGNGYEVQKAVGNPNNLVFTARTVQSL
jgi:hypothetical protein